MAYVWTHKPNLQLLLQVSFYHFMCVTTATVCWTLSAAKTLVNNQYSVNTCRHRWRAEAAATALLTCFFHCLYSSLFSNSIKCEFNSEDNICTTKHLCLLYSLFSSDHSSLEKPGKSNCEIASIFIEFCLWYITLVIFKQQSRKLLWHLNPISSHKDGFI